MSKETHKDQSFLVAIGNEPVGDPVVIGVIGKAAKIEVEEVSRYVNEFFTADDKVPDDPGLYVWEGSIIFEFDDDSDRSTGTVNTSGIWRPATAADLATFGLRPIS